MEGKSESIMHQIPPLAEVEEDPEEDLAERKEKE